MSDSKIELEANKFSEEVINCISNYNENTFDDLFIDEAIASSNFNEGKKYLFDTFKGQIISTEKDSINIGGDYSKFGKSCKPTVIYNITTDENEYLLYFEYYLRGYGYTNKIIRLRLSIKSELPETGGFNNHGGMGNKVGIWFPDFNS